MNIMGTRCCNIPQDPLHLAYNFKRVNRAGINTNVERLGLALCSK